MDNMNEQSMGSEEQILFQLCWNCHLLSRNVRWWYWW